MPGRDRRELAAILAGGAVGALVRVGLLQTGAAGAPGWPWVTFAVNILGAFVLGYFATRLQERLPLSAYRRPLLGTGFCGALTTFSTDAGRAADDARRASVRAAVADTRRRASCWATRASTWRPRSSRRTRTVA